MCYHVSVPDHQNLSNLFANLEMEVTVLEYDHYYHVSGFTHPYLLAMTMENPSVVKPLKWGLVPHYSKDIKDAMKWARQMLNATCEKMETTYKHFYQEKRCLLFVDGFYEWRWEDPEGKVKTPHFIHMPGHVPFTFGGVYNAWLDQASNEWLQTCSIITAPANTRMSEIHNNKKRMPLIIDTKDWGTWLGSPEEAKTLLKPFTDDILQDHIISKSITKKGFNTNIPSIKLPESDNPTTLF